MATKRAYKLQEFVAHASGVNCLEIGRKTSRVLVTGGVDCRVNLWAIGKPNAVLLGYFSDTDLPKLAVEVRIVLYDCSYDVQSLLGHTSAVESVSFDASEVVVAAGAASGTIKLWDLEEAKIVRTFTGHRSNCVCISFHPFGEFFASGSLDTNLKIWDIRRKGCIHTYKGHTLGINAIKFTPDGRWVVSGGEDNTVELWDLTAGKLLHNFNGHEGQIQCIDFHPHEFLLATGSADRSVKFWDLETFESIGLAGPETTAACSMTFNPNGRTLLCGLHESLKVFSWEPIKCHDTVDVGWSRLSDLNVHEGKLLGCSYNQSCVGVWVVDISRIEPYTIGAAIANGHPESDSTSSGCLSMQADISISSSMGRLSVSQNSETVDKETKPTSCIGSLSGISQRTGVSTGSKMTATDSAAAPAATILKRSSLKTHGTTNPQILKSDMVPVIVPRTGSRVELAVEYRNKTAARRALPYTLPSKLTDFQKLSTSRDDSDIVKFSVQSRSMVHKRTESNEVVDQNILSAINQGNQPMTSGERNLEDVRSIGIGKLGANILMEPSPSYHDENYDNRVNKPRDSCSVEISKGRTRSLTPSWERKERSRTYEGPIPSNFSQTISAANISYTSLGCPSSAGRESVSASDEDAIADLTEQHEQFLVSAQSRLKKLQVSADILNVLIEKSDRITLDICTRLLQLITSLLESKIDK